MANEINTNSASVMLNSTQHKTVSSNSSEEKKHVSNNESKTPESDRVSMTSEVSRLKEIEEHLSALPDVNSAKVAEIRQSIVDGSFKIDPQRIADKLLAFENSNNGNA